jgi:hypothetical protein
MGSDLPGWNDGRAKAAITAFVEQTVSDRVPVEERVAVFDADGTLWCEKPMPVEADFVLRRLAEEAEAWPELCDRQPWKAAHARDKDWFAEVITAHYAGDDTLAHTLLAGLGSALAGIDVEDFEAQSGSFLRSTNNPELDRGYPQTAYAPMVELLRFLEANGFSNHIVSGSDGDFIRSVAHDVFGIPPERVIGSDAALEYVSDDHGGTVTRKAQVGFLDDGPQKPIQIWSRLGRRPLCSGGNSNGDVPMLEFTERSDRATLRLLLVHDDAEREFAYTSGAERALATAGECGWTVVSMRNDFSVVFGGMDR